MISENLKKLLIESASCGDPALREFIEERWDTMTCLLETDCDFSETGFTHMQIAVADTALAAARGEIDKMQLVADSYGRNTHKASAYMDSETERNAQSTSWSRSRQKGQNNFARTGESADKAFSVMRSGSRSASFSTMRDTGKRAQGSQASSHDDRTSNGVGKGEGKSHFQTSRSSAGRSGTALSDAYQEPVGFAVPGTYPYVNQTTVDGITYGGPQPTYDTNFPQPTNPGLSCASGAVAPVIPPPIGGISVPLEGVVSAYWAACAPFPSGGASVRTNNRYNFSVSSSKNYVVFSTTLSWGGEGGYSNSIGFRQSAVCGATASAASGRSNSQQEYAQTDASFSEGQSDAQAFGYVQNARRSCDGAESKSTSHLHAESKGESKSCGESHSFDVRRSHAEGQNTGTGQSFMERHAESKDDGLTRAKAKRKLEKFNQVFKQLTQLRDTLFKKLEEQTTRRTRSRPAAASCPPPRGLRMPPLGLLGMCQDKRLGGKIYGRRL